MIADIGERPVDDAALGLSTMTAALFVSADTAAADLPPGCSVSAPDAHLLSGRTVDIDYYFSCNKLTHPVRQCHTQHQTAPRGLPDQTIENYQFDNFRDLPHVAVNSSLQHKPCTPGHWYHGDITVNVSLNATQQFTETRRGNFVTCR
jgi:hypothetical protein